MMDTLTKFSSLVFLLLNIHLYDVYASSNVHHMTNAISWLEANDKCDRKGLEDNEENLKDSNIPNGTEFWIGRAVYSEMTPWIEVFGCTRSTDNDLQVYKVESISQCQKKCDAEKVFGYRYKELDIDCFCFTTWVPTEMNSACDSSSDILLNRYYNGTITDDLLDPGNCVTLCCGYCNTLQSDMLVGRNCGATNEDSVGRCTPFHEPDQIWGKNFITSRNYCWKINKLLLAPSFCESRKDKSKFNGVRAWTNIFREKFDVEKPGFHHHPKLCYKGILHKTRNETKRIDMYRGNCNDGVKWFICKNTTIFDSQRSTTGKRSTLPSLEVPTLQQSSTSVIIGGLIGAFVLLIILAAIFVCRKKSLGLFKEKKKTKDKTEEFSPTPNYNLQYVSASHVEPISNQNYGIATNLSPTYAVVNKLTKSDKKFTEKDETYMDSLDGQYDQLNNIQKRKIILEGNLYDSHEGMRDQNDPTYDSSKLSRSHEVTDVYDHSFLGTQNDGEYAYSSTYKSASTNETDKI